MLGPLPRDFFVVGISYFLSQRMRQPKQRTAVFYSGRNLTQPEETQYRDDDDN
jgi:hypothetical protein